MNARKEFRKTQKKLKQIRKEFKERLILLVTTAFGFVAALSWNDAIKALIQEYVPSGGSWPYLLLSAIIVTIIAVIAIVLINKYTKKE